MYTLGGSQVALKHQGCAIGERVVFLGTGPLLYLVAYQYLSLIHILTHEMGFARRVADRVIFMDGGKIVEDCPKDAFFGDVEARAPRTRQFLSKILQH